MPVRGPFPSYVLLMKSGNSICAFPVQLSEQLSVKSASATFNFLGSLVEAVPDTARSLATQYGEFSVTQVHWSLVNRCVGGCLIINS